MKRCPDCDSPLFRRSAVGVEVDGCNGCGTVWLDGGELRQIAQVGADSLREVDRLFRAGMQPIVAPQQTNLCPVCRVGLAETGYPGIASLKIRACGQCKGVALADGQLTTVAQHLGGPQVQAQPQQPQPQLQTQPPQHTPRISSPDAAHAAALAAVQGTQPPQPFGTPSPAGPSAAAFVPPQAPTDHADHTDTSQLPVIKGHVLPTVQHSTGFMDKLSRGMSFIKSAYALGWNNKGLMLPILIGGLGALVFLGINAGLFIAVAGTEGPEIKTWLRDNPGVATAWGFFLIFGQQLINYGSMGMCVNMVDAYLKGLPPRLGTAFKDVMKNMGGIVALAIVGTLIEIVVSSLRNRRRRSGFGAQSFLYGALAGIIDSFWTVASFLVLPVIMIEDVGLGTGLGRAKNLHKGNLMQIAVGEVGINLVQGFTSFFIVVLIFLMGAMLVPMGAGGIVAFIVIASVLVALMSTVNVFAKATYYTCLYLWTVEVERVGVGQPAMVPAPLATALA